MIIKYFNFLKENAFMDKFKMLYSVAPEGLKKEIDKTKEIQQNIEWHPEKYVYDHIRYVTNRLHNCYGDINLTLSGFFHDLGKIQTTVFNTEKNTWTAYDHENSSVVTLHKYRDWVIGQGGDFIIIEYVVQNHMRYKYLEDMKLQEQTKMITHPFFSYLQKFSTADYGGDGLNCHPIKDISHIYDKINKIEREKKLSKIINSKFNGRMVMDRYPDIKGPDLGITLTKFKSTFNDFNDYILNTDSEQIMKDFDNFIKNI